MVKKIYKLKKDCGKYKTPADSSSKRLHAFIMHVNKSRLQKALKVQKKFKRPNPWLTVLKLRTFYYAIVGLIILFSRLGR